MTVVLVAVIEETDEDGGGCVCFPLVGSFDFGDACNFRCSVSSSSISGASEISKSMETSFL